MGREGVGRGREREREIVEQVVVIGCVVSASRTTKCPRFVVAGIRQSHSEEGDC